MPCMQPDPKQRCRQKSPRQRIFTFHKHSCQLFSSQSLAEGCAPESPDLRVHIDGIGHAYNVWRLEPHFIEFSLADRLLTIGNFRNLGLRRRCQKWLRDRLPSMVPRKKCQRFFLFAGRMFRRPNDVALRNFPSSEVSFSVWLQQACPPPTVRQIASVRSHRV